MSLLSQQGQDSPTGAQLWLEPGSERSVEQMLRKVAMPERPQVTGASSESGWSGDRKNRGGTCQHTAVLVALPSKTQENHARTAIHGNPENRMQVREARMSTPLTQILRGELWRQKVAWKMGRLGSGCPQKPHFFKVFFILFFFLHLFV